MMHTKLLPFPKQSTRVSSFARNLSAQTWASTQHIYKLLIHLNALKKTHADTPLALFPPLFQAMNLSFVLPETLATSIETHLSGGSNELSFSGLANLFGAIQKETQACLPQQAALVSAFVINAVMVLDNRPILMFDPDMSLATQIEDAGFLKLGQPPLSVEKTPQNMVYTYANGTKKIVHLNS